MKNIHMINDLPHMYELEDMIKFAGKYKHLYIYGRGIQQEYLLKYLDMCEIHVDGYVVTNKANVEAPFIYRQVPVIEFKEAVTKESVGMILGLSDRYYGQIIPMMRENKFENYFLLSEYSKRTIAEQIMPRTKSELTFEISLVDHCNLSCQMCDHYSQLSKPWCVNMDTYEKDMSRMGVLFNHEIGCITLLGGEPTLHSNLIECIQIARREFPDSQIIILTNGVKLLELENGANGNLWDECRKNKIDITVTVYPVKLD